MRKLLRHWIRMVAAVGVVAFVLLLLPESVRRPLGIEGTVMLWLFVAGLAAAAVLLCWLLVWAVRRQRMLQDHAWQSGDRQAQAAQEDAVRTAIVLDRGNRPGGL